MTISQTIFKRISALVYLAIAITALTLLLLILPKLNAELDARHLALPATLATLACLLSIGFVIRPKKPVFVSPVTVVPPAEAGDALAAIPDLIWTIDYASRRITPQNLALSVHHPDGQTQSKLAALFPARVSRQYLECLIRIQNTQASQRFEYTLDNEDITFEARLSALTPRSCLVIIRDISSTKATEAALLQQQLFTQQILDANPSLIFVRDRHARFLLVNQATQALLGHELLMQSHMGLDADDTAILTAGDAEVLQRGNTVRLEESCTLLNGRTHWFDLTKIPLEREGQVYVLTIAIDITHLKESESAQAGTSTLVRAMADVLPQPFLLVENDTIQFANTAACERLGLAASDLIGENLSKLHLSDADIATLTQLKNSAGDAVNYSKHKVERASNDTHLLALH